MALIIGYFAIRARPRRGDGDRGRASLGRSCDDVSIDLFVNGTLMRGLALHANLAGAEFLDARRTAPRYRIFSIGDVHPACSKCPRGRAGCRWPASCTACPTTSRRVEAASPGPLSWARCPERRAGRQAFCSRATLQIRPENRRSPSTAAGATTSTAATPRDPRQRPSASRGQPPCNGIREEPADVPRPATFEPD